jgi:hypothetical protein
MLTAGIRAVTNVPCATELDADEGQETPTANKLAIGCGACLKYFLVSTRAFCLSCPSLA